jgi:hypothetical protein
MKIEHLLLALLIAMWAVVLLIMVYPEVEGAGGAVHPQYSTMRQGGSGLDRHGDLMWANWAFGALAIVFFVALIGLGARTGGRLRGLRTPLFVSGIVYLAAWTWLVAAYEGYMRDGVRTLFLALPLPSAVMIYVLLPVSLVFTLLYVRGFSRWVLSDEDLASYERLLAEREAHGSTPADADRGEDQTSTSEDG